MQRHHVNLEGKENACCRLPMISKLCSHVLNAEAYKITSGYPHLCPCWSTSSSISYRRQVLIYLERATSKI